MIILIIVLLLILFSSNTECLTVRPGAVAKKQFSNDIVNNKHLFSSTSNFEVARNKLSWLDAITYEDARKLHREKMLDSNNIMKYL